MSTDIKQASGSLGNARKTFLRNVTFHYRTHCTVGSHPVCFSLLNREVSQRTRGFSHGTRAQRVSFLSTSPSIPPWWHAWVNTGPVHLAGLALCLGSIRHTQARWLSLNASPLGKVCSCSINPRAAFHSAGLGLRAVQVEPTLRGPCLLLRFLSGVWAVSSLSLMASSSWHLPYMDSGSFKVWHMLSYSHWRGIKGFAKLENKWMV